MNKQNNEHVDNLYTQIIQECDLEMIDKLQFALEVYLIEQDTNEK